MKKLELRQYRRLFFVAGNRQYYDAQLQEQAVKRHFADSSLSELEIMDGDYSRRSGHAAAEAIFPRVREGDCVFLANDRMATGFYRYCYENTISIPDQIGVVGSDDDEAARALYPDLTTIHQLAHNDTGLDGLTYADIVGNQQAHGGQTQCHQQRHQLVGAWLHGNVAERSERSSTRTQF